MKVRMLCRLSSAPFPHLVFPFPQVGMERGRSWGFKSRQRNFARA